MYNNIDKFFQGFAEGGGVGFERGRGSMYDSYPVSREEEEEEKEREERSFPDYGPPSVPSPIFGDSSDSLGGDDRPSFPVSDSSGGDNFSMLSPEDERRYAREEVSPFSAIYDLNRQLDADLASEGRRPVLGGLFSKEPGFGTSTNRFEGLSGIKNVLVSALDPLARAIDAPSSAMQGLIPQEDMLSEGLGSAGFATLGGGAVNQLARRSDGTVDYDPVIMGFDDDYDPIPKPDRNIFSGALDFIKGQSLPSPRNESERMARDILRLRQEGRANEVTKEMMAEADPQYMFENTPLDMSGEARMQRLRDMGFDTDTLLYHGTNRDFPYFKGTGSGIFASETPGVADSYIERPYFDSYENYNKKTKAFGSPVMYPVFAKQSGFSDPYYRDPYEIDADGNLYHSVPIENLPSDIKPANNYSFNVKDTDYILDRIIGVDGAGANFRNIKDPGGYDGSDYRYPGETKLSPSFVQRRMEVNTPQTVVARVDPTMMRGLFSRADPEFAHLPNLVAANQSKSAGLGSIAASGQQRRTPDDIQDYLDSLNKRAPINEFENQKAQMISGGLSGGNLEFALNNLARRLGIERPDK